MPYTRITEYKHLTGQEAPNTSITYEYPRAEGDPYYPVPRPENQALFKRYEALADATEDVTFVGRLATYRYYNMDQVVGQALATYRRHIEKLDADDGSRSRPPNERAPIRSSRAACWCWAAPAISAATPCLRSTPRATACRCSTICRPASARRCRRTCDFHEGDIGDAAFLGARAEGRAGSTRSCISRRR